MILEVLIRLSTHVHIEPHDLLIVSTEDKVVALRMQCYRRNPLRSRLILVDHGLLLEVVLEHSLMCGNEEVRLRRMELHGLNDTLGLSEWSLRRGLRQGVDHNLG